MAKKAAKKRVAKKSNTSIVQQFSSMAFDAQKAMLEQLSNLYEGAKKTRAAQLMAELTSLGVTTGKKSGRGKAKANGAKHPLAGRKAKAKYRSKKDSSLTWAGRGLPPKWMKEEMKGGKLKKEDFLIAK